MKNLFTLLLFILYTISIANSQTIWSKSFGGISFDFAKSMDVDDQGDIHVLSTFYGTVDLDPGDESFTVQGYNVDNIAIQKFNGNGEIIWIDVILSEYLLECSEIVTDNQSNVYIIGNFDNQVDFNPGLLTHFAASTGSADAFILKLNSQGDFDWVKTYQSEESISITDIALDSNEDLLICGVFSGTVDLDPGTEVDSYTCIGSINSFIQKLNNDGVVQWTQILETEGSTKANDISSNSNSNVVVSGSFDDLTDFDPSSESENITPTGSGISAFLLSLTELGEFDFVNTLESTISAAYSDVKCNSSSDIYLTGFFYGTSDFNPGENEENQTVEVTSTFIQKITENGSFEWVKILYGDENSASSGFSIELDNEENILITGDFGGPVDFDPNSGIINLNYLLNNVYVLSLNEEGEYISAYSLSSTSNCYVGDVGVSPSNEVYALGSFTDSVNVNFSDVSQYLVSNGFIDVIIIKIGYSLDVSNKASELKINVYPNPTSDIIFINNFENKSLNIQLYKPNGKLVMENKIDDSSTIKLSIDHLNAGLYFLKIFDGINYKSIKLIKQ